MALVKTHRPAGSDWKPAGRVLKQRVSPSPARRKRYFFGAASFSILSEAFFSSLVEGAAGAGSLFDSLLPSTAAPQPQLLFTSLPQLEQPQLFCSQPQLLPQLEQPQLWWQQHELQPPQLPQLPENRWLKQPPHEPHEPWLPQLPMPQPPQLPQLGRLMLQPPHEPHEPQLPLLPNQPALAVQGTAKAATIKAMREKFIPKSPFAYALPGAMTSPSDEPQSSAEAGKT
jgi:hypothetical protein